MKINWNTGRPKINGEYVIVNKWKYVTTLPFTVEYGWNTTSADNKDCAIAEDTVVAWAENFAPHVIDIYGHRGIMTEKEGENAEGV